VLKILSSILYITFIFYGLLLSQDFEYVIGDKYFSLPNLLLPQKGILINDPDFHTAIMRITDADNDIEGSEYAYNQYSRYSPINSSGRYLIVHTAGKFYQIYDLTTNSVVGRAPHIAFDIGEYPYGETNGDGEPEYRWDFSGKHPTRLYYRYNTKFYQADILSGQNVLIRDFKNDFLELDNFHYIFNDDEGEASADSRYWAFMAMGTWKTGMGSIPCHYIFTYDKDQDKIIGKLPVIPHAYKPNFVDISPNGKKIIAAWGWHNGEAGSHYDGVTAYNLDFSNPIKVGDEQKHSGWAFDFKGNQVFVQAWDNNDYIIATNVETGEKTKIKYFTDFGGWDVNWHFSRIYNPNIKGWILMSLYDDDYNEWGDNQILMLEIKPQEENPRIWRIANSYGISGINEFSSPAAALNWQGNRVVWTSNWEGKSVSEVYQAILPDSWYRDLSVQVGNDTIAPQISNITLDSLTAESIIICWTTDEMANGQVEYGESVEYGNTTDIDTMMSLYHTLSLSNLKPNTLYHFRIRAKDIKDNLAISSDSTFLTKFITHIKSSIKPLEQYNFYQNYPNPFNASTTILCELKKRARIVINIYNINGKKIIQLVNSEYSAGRLELSWNSRDQYGELVPSGLYFSEIQVYSLDGGNQYSHKIAKMLLLK
jgi:hypothetical protein